jgi:ABC-type Fe3+ transport system substrate-binding protein
MPIRRSVLLAALPLAGLTMSLAVVAPGASASPKSYAGSATKVAAPTAAQWAAVVKEAKKEGEVTIAGSSTIESVDQQIDNAFTAKYGIKVNEEPINGSFEAQYDTELAAGKVTQDIRSTGTSECDELYSTNDLQTFGQLPIMGAAKSTWLTDPFASIRVGRPGILYNQVSGYFLVENKSIFPGNTGPQSYKALANPEYKGQIILDTPGAPSFGTYFVAATWQKYGESYVRGVLANTKSLDGGDSTTGLNEVANGNAGVFVMAISDSVSSLVNIPNPTVKLVVPSDGMLVSIGAQCLLKDAPDPAAAALFLNFQDSRTAQLAYAKGIGGAFIRSDIKPVDPQLAPAYSLTAKGKGHVKLFPVDAPANYAFYVGGTKANPTPGPYFTIGTAVAAMLPSYGLASS